MAETALRFVALGNPRIPICVLKQKSLTTPRLTPKFLLNDDGNLAS